MVVDSHEYFMRLAIAEAWRYQGLTYPNPAVGCTVVSTDGRLLSVEAHHRAGEAHAEVNALAQAYYKLTDDKTILLLKNSADIHTFLLQNHHGVFKNTRLYTTLEPCVHQGKTPSCASLIAALGIAEVYVATLDTNPIAEGGNRVLQLSGCRVVENICSAEAAQLVMPFQRWQKKNFIFFKWAQRLNATVDEGVISSEASRRHVHALRDRCDLLVVGGETVRKDRPTLDARLVGGHAPDILIVSRAKDFDRTIPLFHVEGRSVFIESDFSRLEEYKNIMIEGGDLMFNLTKGFVDIYLCYIAPLFGGKSHLGTQESRFEILNLSQESQDIIIWMKRVEEQK